MFLSARLHLLQDSVKMNTLLQRLWELKLEWDDPVPQMIEDVWSQWRKELPSLTTLPIPQCYQPKDFPVTSFQLHGFSDVSEEAYTGVVYLRLESVWREGCMQGMVTRCSRLVTTVKSSSSDGRVHTL